MILAQDSSVALNKKPSIKSILTTTAFALIIFLLSYNLAAAFFKPKLEISLQPVLEEIKNSPEISPDNEAKLTMAVISHALKTTNREMVNIVTTPLKELQESRKALLNKLIEINHANQKE